MTSSSHTVTALIPTYNRSKYLAEALESVLTQSHPPQKVVVIDDGSTDETPQVLDAFGDRIAVLRKENDGKSSALNLGVQDVNTDFVWFFDDDDIANPSFLQTHLAQIEEGAGFTYAPHSALEEVAEGVFVDGEQAQGKDIAQENVFYTLLWSVPFMMGGMLIRTDCLRHVGAFDERLTRSQDYDYMLRLASLYTGTAVQEVAYKRRKHLGERGKSGERFSWSEATRGWYRYEKDVFRKLHANVPLETYVPKGSVPEKHLTRAAFMTRFAVMYRYGVLELAQKDLATLNEMQPIDSLTAYESDVLRMAGDSPKWPCMLHDVDMASVFSAANGLLPKELGSYMAAGAYYKLRRDWSGLSMADKFRQVGTVIKLRMAR